MKVLLEFSTHHYFHTVKKTKLYCPSCGKRTVWVDESSDDYYLGSNYYCISCNSMHCLDFCVTKMDNPYQMIIEQIKRNECFVPTTPKPKVDKNLQEIHRQFCKSLYGDGTE